MDQSGAEGVRAEATYSDWMTRGFPKVGDILFTTEAPLGNAAMVDVTVPFRGSPSGRSASTVPTSTRRTDVCHCSVPGSPTNCVGERRE